MVHAYQECNHFDYNLDDVDKEALDMTLSLLFRAGFNTYELVYRERSDAQCIPRHAARPTAKVDA